MSAILFRVENDLAKYQEMNDSLAGFREILGDWQLELKNGILLQYFTKEMKETGLGTIIAGVI